MNNVRTHTVFASFTNEELVKLALDARQPLSTELAYRLEDALEDALSFRYMVEETLDGRG